MTDGTHDQLQVAFPASPTFTRIGRVAVVGLALRLGLDVSTVEKLRTAVDSAVSALQGSGRISAHASWTPTELQITLSNPEADVEERNSLSAELSELVGQASVESTQVTLTLETEPE
ncbi:MAG: hypothetical protein ACR2QK_24595 [Acidimicrobiales bacterium]